MTKLKILTTCVEHWTCGYADGCGAEVEYVSVGGDDPKRLDGHSTGDGIGEVVVPVGVKRLMDVAKEFKPDVFLFGKHHGLTSGMVESVKDRCDCKIAMHYCDQRNGVHEEVARYIGLLDLLLVTNDDKGDHAKYVDAGIPVVKRFLDGVDIDIYNAEKTRGIETSHDVFFGGNNWHGLVRELVSKGRSVMPEIVFPGGHFRDQLLMAVDAEFDLLIHGSHGWGMNDWRNEIGEPVYHPEYAGVMARGEVILSSTNYVLDGLITRRTLRSVAVGRPFIVDFVPGMMVELEDGVHLSVYKSIGEALERIEMCMFDTVYRQRLVSEGPRLIAAKHTFRHRLLDFVGICREVF